ncbi:MAG: transposase [Aggregatilineales bacterium]
MVTVPLPFLTYASAHHRQGQLRSTDWGSSAGIPIILRNRPRSRQRLSTALDDWLGRAAATPGLGSFVNGVRHDYAAVSAALSTEYSNGQVEGQVNRLKFIKRQGYGRANFDLLRRRILLARA